MRVLVALLVFIGLWGMTAPPPALAHHETINEGVIIEGAVTGSWLPVVPSDVGLTITVWVGSATGPATLFVDVTTSPALNDQRAAPDVLIATSGGEFLVTATYTYSGDMEGTSPVAVRSDSAGAKPYLRAGVIDWPSPVFNFALTGTRRLIAPPLRV